MTDDKRRRRNIYLTEAEYQAIVDARLPDPDRMDGKEFLQVTIRRLLASGLTVEKGE